MTLNTGTLAVPSTQSEAETYQRLRAHLGFLKLTDAAEALPRVLDEARAAKLTPVAMLEALLAVEVCAVEDRRLTSRLRFACLPAPWGLDDFDYSAQPGVDESLIRELATLRFVEQGSNVLFIGPPGVGKTMLAVGLARAAAETGHRVYFTTAADLAARCHKAAIEGRWATMMRFYAGPRLLVIDELGYLPLAADAASALFQVINTRYANRASTAITTNLGIASWATAFGDPVVAAAMLDRLLHQGVVVGIDGPSYRLRSHQARAEALRTGVSTDAQGRAPRPSPATLPGVLDLVHSQQPEQPQPTALLQRRLPDRGLATPPRTSADPGPTRHQTRSHPRRQRNRGRTPPDPTTATTTPRTEITHEPRLNHYPGRRPG